MKRIIPLLALATLFIVSCDKGPDPTKGYLEIKNDSGMKTYVYIDLDADMQIDRYNYIIKNMQPDDIDIRKVPIGRYIINVDYGGPFYESEYTNLIIVEVESYKTTHVSIINPEGL